MCSDAAHRHLVPADARRGEAVDEHHPRTLRDVDRGRQPAVEPRGLQTGRAGAIAVRRRPGGERCDAAVDRHSQCRCERGAAPTCVRRPFGCRDGPVMVGIDRAPGLLCGDLRGVDDCVVVDRVRRHDEPVVVVDGEVSQRMRACGRCRHQHQGRGGEGHRDRAPHGARLSAARSARARGAQSGLNDGLSRSAAARSVRASLIRPSERSISPR